MLTIFAIMVIADHGSATPVVFSLEIDILEATFPGLVSRC